MLELTPQQEAQNIAALSAWVLLAEEFRQMLTDAGCTDDEARYVMTAEVQ
jgi:hypothetical protein